MFLVIIIRIKNNLKLFDFLYSLNPRYIDVENEQEGRNYLVNNDLTACLSEYIVIKDNKFYVRSLNLSYEYYAILPKEELVQDISNYFINDTRLLEEINDYQNLSIDPNIGQVYYFCLDDVKLDTKNIELNVIKIKEENEIKEIMLYRNKNILYFVQKKNRIYLKSLRYSFDIEKEIKDLENTYSRIEQIGFENSLEFESFFELSCK